MPVPATPAPEPHRWYAQEVLLGSKVTLAPLQLEHAEGYAAAVRSDGGAEEVYRWLGRATIPVTAELARAEILAALAARARGEQFPFAQLDAGTGEVLGATSYYEVRPELRALAIGHTWLGRRWWRTGHNTESKLLLLSQAFEVLGAARVVWHTDVLNERSRAAIQRLGARPEGVLRKHRIRADGTWRDTAQYAMTDEDWPEARDRLRASLRR
ncbi:MAG TPA: GNAT family protein [Jatrophihabitans sp.]|jgi:RimJ/RimL family protein N-acetyltransferase|uniref:GNAT family N-acetyltransferase n=1 Tax=Jatrophihabitans sp. TaxID=1932789 RepID=UPI002F1EAB75